jgi:mono/diheme cytochrome c family protein
MTWSGRKQLLLWIAAALLGGAALMTVLIRERAPSPARRSLYVVGVPERGEELFFGGQQCSFCHSIRGHGGQVAPDLAAKRPGTPAMGWFATAMWNHAPGMYRRLRTGKSFPQLDTQQMADMLAFLYQASNFDRAGDPAAGEKVFRDKGCVTCHSVRGKGGKSAPELSSLGAEGSNELARAMWNHTQSMMEPVTKTLGQWPQFKGDEMTDLIAFASQGQTQAPGKGDKADRPGDAERGWNVFQASCIQCHAVRGHGGSLGPELGPERNLPLTTMQFASVLWNHAPSMVSLGRQNGIAVPTLQREQMADLAAFLASLRYFEPTGSPFVGGDVFKLRGCARCHGVEAEGTQLGPRLRAAGDAFTATSFTAALWRHGPKMITRAEETGVPWPTLEPSDIGDLVSFLNSPQRSK